MKKIKKIVFPDSFCNTYLMKDRLTSSEINDVLLAPVLEDLEESKESSFSTKNAIVIGWKDHKGQRRIIVARDYFEIDEMH